MRRAKFMDCIGCKKNYVPSAMYCSEKECPFGVPYTEKPSHPSITNEELQEKLRAFPKDALVVVEYCNIREIRYDKKTNLITID